MLSSDPTPFIFLFSHFTFIIDVSSLLSNLQVTYQLKILTTAVFSVIMLDKVLGELQYLPNILPSQYVLYT